MNADADVVVVGAGHNGLIAAGYLAAAGKRVLVLERNGYPGGGVATAELAERGFLDERASLLHVRILANPLITSDELELQSRYGLDYVHVGTPHTVIFEDGSYLPIGHDRAATMAHIQQFSGRDVEAYDSFMALALQILKVVTPGFFVPPAAMHDRMMVLGASALGKEILRVSSMSVADVLGEWFTDERVRVALSRMAAELTLAHPDDLNTGLIAYLAPAMTERYGMAMPRGGGSTFTEACVRCIEDHGGDVRMSVDVTEILTSGGRATGVRTREGEELRAVDAVLAAIHPHHLGRVVQGLDSKVAQAAASTKLAPYSALVVHASLNEPLRFKAGSAVDRSVWNTLSTSSLEVMNHAFDDLRRGRLPLIPLLEAGCPSQADPTRAPEGKAVLHMLCLTTRELADGGPDRWNAIKDTVADSLFNRLGEFTTNLTPDLVRARALVSPLDHERNSSSFVGGDYTGIASYTHQMGALRPTPALSQYTVPGIGGLYLTGPFMHPGGGASAADARRRSRCSRIWT